MMVPDQAEGDTSSTESKRAVTFSVLDIMEERVVEMSNPRRNPDCNTDKDLVCDLSIDKLQMTEFISKTLR